MAYDEIECNRNNDRGNPLPTLTYLTSYLTSERFTVPSELCNPEGKKSPQVGFEPTTNRLTADRSTTELLRNNGKFYLIEFHPFSQPITNIRPKFPL